MAIQWKHIWQNLLCNIDFNWTLQRDLPLFNFVYTMAKSKSLPNSLSLFVLCDWGNVCPVLLSLSPCSSCVFQIEAMFVLCDWVWVRVCPVLLWLSQCSSSVIVIESVCVLCYCDWVRVHDIRVTYHRPWVRSKGSDCRDRLSWTLLQFGKPGWTLVCELPACLL